MIAFLVLSISVRRGAAVVLAALVLAFCLSSVAAVAGPDPGCEGYQASPKTCAQPGGADPVLSVASRGPSVVWFEPPAARLLLTPVARSVFQFHPGSSAPRAPPSSLS